MLEQIPNEHRGKFVEFCFKTIPKSIPALAFDLAFIFASTLTNCPVPWRGSGDDELYSTVENHSSSLIIHNTRHHLVRNVPSVHEIWRFPNSGTPKSSMFKEIFLYISIESHPAVRVPPWLIRTPPHVAFVDPTPWSWQACSFSSSGSAASIATGGKCLGKNVHDHPNQSTKQGANSLQ